MIKYGKVILLTKTLIKKAYYLGLRTMLPAKKLFLTN